MSEDTKKYSAVYPVKKVRVWGKGQLTIPAEVRDILMIKEDTILDLYQVGNAIVATPEKTLISELSGEFAKTMQKEKLSLEDLLSELREGSHDYETD